jgi:hypothetical protein
MSYEFSPSAVWGIAAGRRWGHAISVLRRVQRFIDRHPRAPIAHARDARVAYVACVAGAPGYDYAFCASVVTAGARGDFFCNGWIRL